VAVDADLGGTTMRRSTRSPSGPWGDASAPVPGAAFGPGQSWRRAGFALVGLVSVSLVCGMVSPVWAGESDPSAGGSAVVGSFALGDGLEAAVDERDGSVRFNLLAGGLALAWDSKAAGGGDRSGFGPGWGFGLAHLGTTGGVQVFPASGGSYAPDDSHPSGLSAYGVEDVWFSQEPGTRPGRDVDLGSGLPGQIPEVSYQFVLHELGGTVTYFNEAGDPVESTTATGERTNWIWAPSMPHRLLGVVSPDGFVTTLDWDDPAAVLVTQGANLPGETDPVTGEVGPVPVWRIELDGGRVAALMDPVGGRTEVGYDRATGLVSTISGESGGTTQVEWQVFDDATLRAARVRSIDGDGRELSVREWAPAGDGTPSSGWPTYADEGALFWSHDRSTTYTTVLSDGPTRVFSEYNSQHRIIDRRMVVTTPSGEATIQQQGFIYPGTEGGELPDPAALPANWSRPTSTAITHRDAKGGQRTETQLAEFDEFGREISRTTPDNTVTTTEYDPVVPDGGVLPVGLPLVERVTAADGLVQETRYTPDEEVRASVVKTETFAGRADDETLTRTGLAEFELGDRGIVTAKKVYPSGDAEATPVVARWDRELSLDEGTMTVTKTVAVGTPAAASTTEVSSLRHGEVLVATDPLGNVMRTGHDPLGRPTRIIDAAERVATNVYETAVQYGRNATTTTRPDGVEVTEIRDALGRVERVTDNIDQGTAVRGFTRVVETRGYPEPGLLTVTDAWGATTTARYDPFGRTTSSTGPTGVSQITRHDDVAHTVTTGLTPTDSLEDAEQVTTETKDDRGRSTLGTGTRRDGVAVPEVRAEYDGLGRLTTSSSDGLETDTRYDTFGDAVETAITPVDGAPAMTAARQFDGFGVALEKTLTSGDEQRSGGSREMDELGRTVRETDQLGRVTRTQYTPDGRVEKSVSDHGPTIERAYDGVTRALIESTVSSPVGETVRTAYEHDPLTGTVLAVFDPTDRAGSEISYTYDAHGNPLTITYPDGKQIGHAYDPHGRRIQTTDIIGNVTDLTYTPEGVLTRATQRDADDETIAEVSYDHDELGRVSTLTRGNGVTTTFAFTSASQIAKETTADRDGRVLSDRAYTYDPRGNLTQREDITYDASSDAEHSTTTYVYDAFDRLTGSTTHDGTASGGGQTRIEYELTVSGDIRAETTTTDPGSGGQVSTTRTFEYSPSGELVGRATSTRSAESPESDEALSQTQEYDAAGNLVLAFDGTRHAYDAANRPVTDFEPDGGVVRTSYWADGTRRGTVTDDAAGAPAASVSLYWDGGSVLNELHHADAAERSGFVGYLIGAGRHARTAVDGNGATPTWYFGSDRHGSITELIDAGGAVVARFAYSDYGVRTVESDDALMDAGLRRNPFGFAGEYTDPSGMQYLRSRVYDPEDRRFTTKDVAQLHNLYAYADLNPITNIDPSGREAHPDYTMIANWATFALSLVLLAVGGVAIATMLRAANVARSVAAASRFVSIQEWGARLGTVSAKNWATIILGLGFDLASTVTSGTLAYNDTIGAFTDDEELMKNLMWVDIGVAVGAAFTGYFAYRALKRETDVVRMQQTEARAIQRIDKRTREQAMKAARDKPLPGAEQPDQLLLPGPDEVDVPASLVRNDSQGLPTTARSRSNSEVQPLAPATKPTHEDELALHCAQLLACAENMTDEAADAVVALIGHAESAAPKTFGALSTNLETTIDIMRTIERGTPSAYKPLVDKLWDHALKRPLAASMGKFG
jgi:RHS repeat-associated protein